MIVSRLVYCSTGSTRTT